MRAADFNVLRVQKMTVTQGAVTGRVLTCVNSNGDVQWQDGGNSANGVVGSDGGSVVFHSDSPLSTGSPPTYGDTTQRWIRVNNTVLVRGSTTMKFDNLPAVSTVAFNITIPIQRTAVFQASSLYNTHYSGSATAQFSNGFNPAGNCGGFGYGVFGTNDEFTFILRANSPITNVSNTLTSIITYSYIYEIEPT